MRSTRLNWFYMKPLLLSNNTVRQDLLIDLTNKDAAFNAEDVRWIYQAVQMAEVGVLFVPAIFKKVPAKFIAPWRPLIIEIVPQHPKAQGTLLILVVKRPATDDLSEAVAVFPISFGPRGYAFNGVRYQVPAPYGLGSPVEIDAPLVDASTRGLSQALIYSGFHYTEAKRRALVGGVYKVQL